MDGVLKRRSLIVRVSVTSGLVTRWERDVTLIGGRDPVKEGEKYWWVIHSVGEREICVSEREGSLVGGRGSDVLRHVEIANGDGGMGDLADGLRVFIIEFFDQLIRVNMRCWFPTVLCLGESFPPYEILKLVSPAP